jgi:hypothetical protein
MDETGISKDYSENTTITNVGEKHVKIITNLDEK